MPVPVVVDTDTAQDDCIALLACLLDPAADLRAITMVAGNVGFDRQLHNAMLTLNAAGCLGRVPVHLGCRRPMMREWVSAENVHGDGVGGMTMDDADCVPRPEHAVDALVRMAAQAPGELTVVCIGPLTNIAAACLKDPDFPANIGRLYIMGGSNNGRGNITAAAEFNFYVDPEAAKAVFAAGFDITVVPWAPLTLEQAVFPPSVLERIAELGTPLADFFTRVCAATLAFDRRVGIDGTTHPDSLTAALLLHPQLATRVGDYHVDVETAGELTRGYSAMSWGVHGLAPNARVVEEVDAEGFREYLLGVLATPTTPDRPIRVP